MDRRQKEDSVSQLKEKFQKASIAILAEFSAWASRFLH